MGDMSNPVSTETRQSLRDRLSTLEAENADLRRDLARQRDELEEFIDLLQEMEHFFEAAREPFAILHGDGRFRRVNKALLKVLGLDRLEARGATLFDFVSEDDRKYLQELFSTRDERFFDRDLTATGKSGMRDIHGRFVRTRSGEFFMSAADETARATIERLERDKETTRAFMETAAGVGFWRWKLDEEFPEWSRGMYRIYGRDPAAGPPPLRESYKYYDEETIERIKSLRDRAIESQRSVSASIRIIAEDQSLRFLNLSCLATRDETGTVNGLSGICVDETELREALASRERMEWRLRKALEVSQCVAYEIDFEKKRFHFSGDWRRFRAIRPSYDWFSSQLWSLVHPDDLPEVQEKWRRHVEFGEPYRVEHRFPSPEGEWIWLLSTAKLERNADGKATKCVGLFADIDERKQLELRLRAAEAAARAANRNRGEFFDNISHEIRTPLTGVLAIAGALRNTDLDEKQAEMVGLIANSGETLLRLLNDVLDFSKLQAGRFSLDSAPFDVAHVAASVTHLFRARAEEKGLSLVLDVAPTARRFVLGDKVRLKQILSNLLSNAVKFTNKGGVRMDVEAEANGEDRLSLSFTITDTGIGFDGDQADFLFDRFAQESRSTAANYGGTGLGLAICRSIIEAMGGHLTFWSRPNEGARFTANLTLPCAPLEEAAPPPKNTDPQTGFTALRVLVADDSATNRRVMQMILGAAGCQITCVEDGRQAVDAALSAPFDLILMDMQMPVLDGLAAIEAIRAAEIATGVARRVILAVTANAMDKHQQKALEAGADGHVAKPFTPESLLRAIAAAMAEGGGRATQAA